MKKIALLALALLGLCVAPAVAAEWGAPKVTNVEIGGDYYGSSVGASAGLELGLLQFNLAPEFNFNFAAKAAVGVNLGFSSGIGLGAAGYAVMHYPLKQWNTGIDFVNKLDFYMGLGIGVNFSSSVSFPIGAAYTGGLSYDLNGKLAVFSGFNEFGGAIFGIKTTL